MVEAEKTIGRREGVNPYRFPGWWSGPKTNRGTHETEPLQDYPSTFGRKNDVGEHERECQQEGCCGRDIVDSDHGGTSRFGEYNPFAHPVTDALKP